MASTPAQQAAGGISAAKDPTRALEPRWGGWAGGRPFEGNSALKASTGPGGRHFCDSASDKSVSLHCVREAFGILFLFFLFLKRLILAPQQSPGLRSRRASPEGCQLEAAQGTVPTEDAVPQRRVQIDTGSKSAVWR